MPPQLCNIVTQYMYIQSASGHIIGIPDTKFAKDISDTEKEKITVILQKSREFWESLLKESNITVGRNLHNPDLYTITDSTKLMRMNLVSKTGNSWSSFGIDDVLTVHDLPGALPVSLLKFFADKEQDLLLMIPHKNGDVLLQLSTTEPTRTRDQSSLSALCSRAQGRNS